MVANRLIGWLTGVPLHDYGCSLKAYWAQAIKRTPLYAEFHRFIPALATLTGARIAELPVRHPPRRYGRTKYTLSRTWRVALDMITVSLLIRFSAKPLRIFGGLALLAGLVGMGCLLRSWQWYVWTAEQTPQILPGICLLSLWLAGHLVIVGLIAELCMATAHGRPDELISTTV
jgi:dolichol-phosphate mannosyltransferase